MDLSSEVRKAILKELPVGCAVTYHGPSLPMRGRKLTKLRDTSDKMVVVDDCFNVHRLKYFNLSCDKIRIAIEVARRLNDEPNPDDLPF